MSELAAALGVEAIDDDQLDALVAWATQRAATLSADLHDDPELGPLLRSGGRAPELAATSRRPDTPADRAGTPTEVAREDSKLQQPLPPIPSAQPGYEAAASEAAASGDDEELEELEEVELLDDADLELVEESLRGPAPSPPAEEEVPEWKAALATAQEGDELAVEAKERNRTEDSALMRLRAEEELVKEHDVDLSDLDDV